MFFPLRDSIPAMHRPFMSWAVIVATAAAFLWQQSLPPSAFRDIIYHFGLTPAATPSAASLLHAVTYTFLHSGWWHLIANMWMFWIFADNVEDVMGPWRFAAFYFVCGALAGFAHVVANPASPVPVVGASGAVSGVLGAYFLLYPHARVTTFVFFFIIRLPAALYLGAWFVLQLWSGIGGGATSIAWWAHLGGFVAGMLLVPLFRTNRPLPAVLPQAQEPPPQDDPKDPWKRFRSK